MTTPEPAYDRLSVSEAEEAIDALSDADWVRLKKVSKIYARNRKLCPGDLRQKAFLSVLDGSRKCPRDVAMVNFLAGIMRSLSSSAAKSEALRKELRLVPQHGGDGVEEFDHPDPSPDPEQALASNQECEMILAEVLALFSDDETAQILVEGISDDMSANELRELTGLDEKEYATKRRLIRRRLDRKYPQGWKK